MRKALLAACVGLTVKTAHGTSRITEILFVKRETEAGTMKETKIIFQDDQDNTWSVTFEEQGAREKILALLGEFSEVPSAIIGQLEKTGSKIKGVWDNLVEIGKSSRVNQSET